MQSYVQSMYGFARTVRLDFKGKASMDEDAKPCYSVLEAIKDGTAINEK